jgi:hypothetical protein
MIPLQPRPSWNILKDNSTKIFFLNLVWTVQTQNLVNKYSNLACKEYCKYCNLVFKEYCNLVFKEYCNLVFKEYCNLVCKEYSNLVCKEYSNLVCKEYSNLVT